MKIYIVCVFVLFFLCFGCVSAGENDTGIPYVINESVHDLTSDTVVALEDGHFNTSFSDGSNGYCIEYMEQEATTNDIFYKVDTDYAINTVDNSRVGNYLKLYFTSYTGHALNDPVVTQHMIWHFTDNFNGWRLNYTIIDEIRNSKEIVPDYYTQKLNSTHERVWFFNVLLSPYEHHQNYFSYRFFDRLILDDGNVSFNQTNNNTDNNYTGVVNTTKKDNNTNSTLCVECLNKSNKTIMGNSDVSNIKEKNNEGSSVMLVTGANLYNTITILIMGLIIIVGLYCLQRKYYK